jgi:hypothetical protein
MYVRFVVGSERENPYGLTGLFSHRTIYQESGVLDSHINEYVEDLLVWFKENLKVPPFQQNQAVNRWSERAVCWYKDRAGEPLRRMWDLVAIYREYGILTRLIRTSQPGQIVYEDEHQIVAETPKLRYQDRRLLPRREAIRIRKR